MRKIIFVPTVQSTGTWFVLNFFKEHPNVEFVYAKDAWDKAHLHKEDGITCVYQIHFGISEGAAHESFVQKEELLLKWFENADHIVVPVRDPMRSLLTAYVRGPQLNRTHIVNGFVQLAEFVEKYNIFIVPVDLYAAKDFSQRQKILSSLLNFVGLPKTPYVEEWAQQWPIHNTIGDRFAEEIRKMYDEKDLETISKTIPREFNLLMKNEAKLKPFLQKQGYSNLFWWRS